MRSYYTGLVCLAAVALAVVLVAGCGGEGSSPPAATPRTTYPLTASVMVTITNASNTATHLWVTGQSINPANVVEPGRARVATASRTWQSATDTQTITLYAGRNGTTLAAQSTTLTGQQAESNASVSGSWNGTSVTIN